MMGVSAISLGQLKLMIPLSPRVAGLGMFTRIRIPTSVPGINVENMGHCMGGHGGGAWGPQSSGC